LTQVGTEKLHTKVILEQLEELAIALTALLHTTKDSGTAGRTAEQLSKEQVHTRGWTRRSWNQLANLITEQLQTKIIHEPLEQLATASNKPAAQQRKKKN
jgi:hypothetical protein